jgi:DNA mismatch repair protein MutS
MPDLTPMKRQYKEIKSQYRDCLLFFRLGDFYEMFDEDAVTGSKELDLTLTTRDRGVENPEERTPMCGVPYHAAETYIAKLVAKGYKVAICEQTEDPAKAVGLVSRDVIRIITPGTVTESSMLDESKNNYICAIETGPASAGIAFCDISTGEFSCTSFEEDQISHILNELGRFAPREAVLSQGAAEIAGIRNFLTEKLGALIECGQEGFEYLEASARVCEQFRAQSVDELGLGESPAAVSAAGALLAYLKETQKFDLSHISSPEVSYVKKYMELDWVTARSLELTESQRTGEKRGSLLWVLDRTKTPMGGRMLRSWIEKPLLSAIAIKRRNAAVEELYRNNVVRSETMEILRHITDMQRLIGRIVYGTANGRDLRSLANCCSCLPALAERLASAETAALKNIASMDILSDIAEMIDTAVVDDPPFSVREGGIFRQGFSEELDYLRDVRDNGSSMLARLEARERERTGIKKLKVGYNKVFGYYIDVPKSAGEVNIPEDYIRKQTLVSNERYFTKELKELENTLINARDRIGELEYSFFSELRSTVAQQVTRVQDTAEKVAELDVYCSLAETAVRNSYVKPEIDTSRLLEIKAGRHPVVEQTLKDIPFVPNDVLLDDNLNRVAIVTGPNMAGKSTYMRQTALIILMAQIGSFVPARSATVGIVDRIFTRIGASDDLASGQSTFMVEMSETANILKHATASSFIVLDEIGRGTSTYDGMAIAKAVLEYCADRKKLGAKTMFATHYHELSVLEGEIKGVRNYNITAKKQGDNLVFLRKIVPGAADDSYGIEVAKLAGIPDAVIIRAKKNLKELIGQAATVGDGKKAEDVPQISLQDIAADEIRQKIEAADINSMTPIEALNFLSRLKEMV